MNKTIKLSTALLILFLILIMAIGGLWYMHAHQSKASVPPGVVNVTASSTEVMTSTSQDVGISTSSYRYGVADCSLLATSSDISGYPVVSNTYSLYDSSSTGISFCYPSDITIAIPSGLANPPSQIDWSSGARMNIEFPQSINRGDSAILNLLATCLAGGYNGEDACIAPQGYQIIHAINQNGLDYYIFWTDWENNNTGIFNRNIGPFAYVATPGNPTLFVPSPLGTTQYTPEMLRDLTVIFNTLNISKSL